MVRLFKIGPHEPLQRAIAFYFLTIDDVELAKLCDGKSILVAGMIEAAFHDQAGHIHESLLIYYAKLLRDSL